jgi:hypothetical protein
MPAPAARPSPAAPADAGRDASNFQDYVDAASDTREADEGARAGAKPRRRADRESKSDEGAPQAVAAPISPPEAPAQPLILQVVASVTPQAPAAEAQATTTPTTQAAPVQAAAPVTAPAPQPGAPATPPKTDTQPVAPPVAAANAAAANRKTPAAEAHSTPQAPEQTADADAPAPQAIVQNTPAPTPAQIVQAPAAPAALISATAKAPVTPNTPEIAALLSANEQNGAPKPQVPLVEGKTKAAPQDGKKTPLAPASTPSAAPTQSNANDIARSVANMIAPDAQQAAPAPAAPPAAQPIGLAQAGAMQQPQTALETAAKQATPVPAQIGREIIRRFNGESTSFTLRLDPAELGRVDVRLEVSRDHRVTAVVQADNPQALAELSRGARELEQALQSAGLQLSENGLSFDLSDRRSAFAAQEKSNGGARGVEHAAATPDEPQAVARPIGLEQWRGVRVDLVA